MIGELLLVADQLGLQAVSQGGAVWIAGKSDDVSWWEKHLPWLAPTCILLLVAVSLDWFSPGAKTVDLALGHASAAQSGVAATSSADIDSVESMAVAREVDRRRGVAEVASSEGDIHPLGGSDVLDVTDDARGDASSHELQPSSDAHLFRAAPDIDSEPIPGIDDFDRIVRDTSSAERNVPTWSDSFAVTGRRATACG